MVQAAYIFDCDGVLIDSEAIYIDVERALLADIGLTYPLADYQARFVGMSDRDFQAALAADYGALGRGAFPETLFARRAEECWRRFETELAPVQRITDLLAALDAPKAVASSSTPDALARKLAMTGLAGHFTPHIYSSAMVAHGKPAPDLFLFAAERLSVEPRDCIVIEDSANGVKAGVAAGMRVWGFTGGGHADPGLHGRLFAAGADRVFASHDAILGRIGAPGS